MILHDTVKQPWESSITANTAIASGGFITPVSKLETDIGIISSRYPFTRESVRSGYIPNGFYVTIPYRGRFGEGYIIATPRTTSSVKCVYYLNHGKRGADNAEENEI